MLDPDVEVGVSGIGGAMFRGDLGQPAGGFPAGIQKKVLKGDKPLTTRPGASMPPLDLAQERKTLDEKLGRAATTRSSRRT